MAGVVSDFFSGLVMGDFAEGGSTASTVGQIVGGFIPIVGQVADGRDAAAAVRDIVQGREGGWTNLGLAAVGFIPGVGDAAKAGLRGARHADEAAQAVAVAARRSDEVADGARRADDLVAQADRGCPGGVCSAPGNCFAAGTPVVTERGSKPIERVAVGDVVLARDPETGATTFERVAATFVREDVPVVDLEIATADGAHEHIVVTYEHPIFVHARGFRPVVELAPGDEVDTASGTARVASLASLPEVTTVYNFEVEHAHTYFVGAAATWVHNTCHEVGATPPARSADEIAAEARELADGQRLWREGTRDTPALRDLPIRGPEHRAIHDAIERGELQVRLLPQDSPRLGGFWPPAPGQPAVIEVAYVGRTPSSRQQMAESIYHEGQHYRQWVEAGRPDGDTFYRYYEQNYHWMETEAEVVARSMNRDVTPEMIAAVKQQHTSLYTSEFPAPPPGYMQGTEIRPPGITLGRP